MSMSPYRRVAPQHGRRWAIADAERTPRLMPEELCSAMRACKVCVCSRDMEMDKSWTRRNWVLW